MNAPSPKMDVSDQKPFSAWLFGSLEVQVEGRPLPRLRSRKGQLLLLLLLLRPDTELSREELAEALWSDSPEAQRLVSLRQSLHDLRSAFGTQAFRLESPTPKTLRFQSEGAFIDTLQFEALAKKATSEAEREALSLYRGTLLEQWQDELLYSYQNTFQTQALRLIKRSAKRVIESKDYSEAIRLLRLGIRMEPLQEEFYRNLMGVFAVRGEYAEAIQTYRDIRKLLEQEMGIEPEPETQALYKGIRANVRAQMRETHTQEALPSPPSIATPPVQVPHNLPRLLTRLIGREEECEALSQEIRKHRLVSLLGTAGVGKTRLARDVGHRFVSDLQAPFPEGVWFVELASLTDPSFVLPTLATLFVKENTGTPLLETLLGFLKDKALLLIMDNCEHLLEPCTEIVAKILSHAPKVHILITSREPLETTGEYLYRLQPFLLPTAEAPLETVQSSSAFQLFYERALQARPNWTLTPKEIREIHQICSRLDGIPLAIELASTRLSLFTTEELLARLENRFRLLSGGARTALPRHQTLRAAIDWSYYLLSPEEQALFRRLSLFAGAFSLEDAEAVCGEEEVLGLLPRLVDRSLVLNHFRAGSEPQYQLLESLKEYGREKLQETGEIEEQYQKYCQWYIELATRAYESTGGQYRGFWALRLRSAYDNLRAILQSPPNASLLYRLIARLSRYWVVASDLREGRYWLDLAYSHLSEIEVVDALRIVTNLGYLAWMQSDNAAAKQFLDQGIKLATTHQERRFLGYLFAALGLVYAAEKNRAEAHASYQQALFHAESYQDLTVQASVNANMACLSLESGEFDRAEKEFLKSREIRECLGDKPGIAYVDLYLAHTEEWRGNLLAARSGYISALQCLHETEQHYFIGWGLAFLSNVLVKLEDILHAAYVRGFLVAFRERYGFAPNPTQFEAEKKDQSAILKTFGQEEFEKILAETQDWTIEQALLYIRANIL